MPLEGGKVDNSSSENQKSELENERESTATSQDDISIILEALSLPSGSQLKFRKRWLEFDCQNGVHHGKYATYENKKRTRITGGYVGRFDVATREGEYGQRRVAEFIKTHNCHYAERFSKDLDECGIRGIEVEGWPSGRSISGLAGGGRPSGSEERED